MQRTKPPFRADHVGSFLRPFVPIKWRAQMREGPDRRPRAEQCLDCEIEKIIKKQEEIGLKLATDGEFRRSWWHFDFSASSRRRSNLHAPRTLLRIQFQGVQTKAQSVRIVGEIGFFI